MKRRYYFAAAAAVLTASVAHASSLDPVQTQLDEQANQIEELQQKQRAREPDQTLELIDKIRRAKKEDQVDELTEALATRVIDAQIGVDQLKKQTAQLTEELHSMPQPEEPMRPWQVGTIALGVCVAYSALVTIGKRLLRR
ncbi:hypothetical protein K6L27_05230 [Burkholderia cenocepacia]|uniref:hypothetical protein n=1 Tax=Burkholderia cenocepacia TaxID=95486 RepID=UPI002231DDE1|nr:hypothetical protein [Burkholderia cenocepacia]MCW3657570.1 hypothetical protein [Burkholderia cenocepacia]